MGSPAAWERLADALLRREALRCRLADGLAPHDFAGLYVGVDDVDRILSTLPGLDRPPREAPSDVARVADAAVEAAWGAFLTSFEDGSPFAHLVAGARLKPAEAAALACISAVELSPDRQRLVAYVQDNVQLGRLTVPTLDRLLDTDDASSAALAPGGALLRAGLVGLDGTGGWAQQVAVLPARVCWHLRGVDDPDPDLPADTQLSGQRMGPGHPAAQLLVVHGGDRQTRLLQVAGHWPGSPLLVSRAPGSPHQWAALVREAVVGGRVAVLETEGPLDAAARAEIDRASAVAWTIASPGELPLESLPRRPWTELAVAAGPADEGDWERALGSGLDTSYHLDREQLRLVALAAHGRPEAVPGGVRRLAGGHLDALALRVVPTRTWADLVLPDDQQEQLHELVGRYRNRDVVYGQWGFSAQASRGDIALFAGPSGTGKTLAAEVVAGELGLDLYKIDLSLVVSKYIGETEKNLGRVFDAADAADLVLFFDEADALFGKRTEVKDAHDRYANIEVAYLLQRLESYGGLVVLATNLQRNIDRAFSRRIAVSVEFPLPDEDQRRSIWRGSFPAAAPLDDIDMDFLARQFEITGGVIHQAALGAAFRAAEHGRAITMDDVALSLKREYQKLGRLRTASEFDRYLSLVNGDGDAAPAR